MDKMTAAACSQSECEGCEIQGKLLCVHKPKDLIDFYVLFMGWAIPFFSGMIIGKFWAGMMVWIVLAIIFFGYNVRCGMDVAANSMQPLL